MDGGLDTVHLKKLRLSFLRDFWHCTSENSLRDVFLVLCNGLKLSTDRFMYKIGVKSSSFQLNTMSFLKKQTKINPKLDTHVSLQLSVFKLAPILTEVELCIFFFFILPQLYEQPSSVMRLVAFQVQQCLFIGQEKLFVSGGSVVRELFFLTGGPLAHTKPPCWTSYAVLWL